MSMGTPKMGLIAKAIPRRKTPNPELISFSEIIRTMAANIMIKAKDSFAGSFSAPVVKMTMAMMEKGTERKILHPIRDSDCKAIRTIIPVNVIVEVNENSPLKR